MPRRRQPGAARQAITLNIGSNDELAGDRRSAKSKSTAEFTATGKSKYGCIGREAAVTDCIQ